MNFIADLVRGKERGFRTFYKKTFSAVYGFACKHSTSFEVARDILQIAYLKIWIKREDISPDFQSFKSYLFTIVANDIRKEYLRLIREREAAFEFNYFFESSEEESEDDDVEAKIYELVDAFPIKQKNIFKLVKLEGMSYKQAAQLVGISERTVEKHIAKSMKTLKAAFTTT